MTMSPDPGGVFDTLLGLVRHGLGGSAGDGRQFMSWIHHEDFVAAVRWLIDRDDIEGVVNVAAPNPLPNAEFMRILREACGVRLGFRQARWMLEIGAVFMRTETELILKSRRVVPARLLEHGFKFKYPGLARSRAGSLPSVCGRPRHGRVSISRSRDLMISRSIELLKEVEIGRAGEQLAISRFLLLSMNRLIARSFDHPIVRFPLERENREVAGGLSSGTPADELLVELIGIEATRSPVGRPGPAALHERGAPWSPPRAPRRSSVRSDQAHQSRLGSSEIVVMKIWWS